MGAQLKIAAVYFTGAIAAVTVFATLAIVFAVGPAYGWGKENAKETHPCPDAPLNNNNTTAQAPPGATISHIRTDDMFGCQHLDEARKAGPPDQLIGADLRSGECTRFARGEHVYTVHKAWNSAQTDPDGRRVSPSLFAVQRVGGGPTYYVVGEPDR